MVTRALLSAAACLLGLGCGGLDNRPLTTGVIIGRVSGTVDPSRAWVAIIGHPETKTPITSAGTFRFEGVPEGSAELLGIVSSQQTFRLTGRVQVGLVTDLATVPTQRAATMKVQVKAQGGQRLSGGRVTLDGTPMSDIALDEQGLAIVSPLPPGCYQVITLVPGLGASQTKQTCAASGQNDEVEYELPHADGSEGREGCSVTGCISGLNCRNSGECE